MSLPDREARQRHVLGAQQIKYSRESAHFALHINIGSLCCILQTNEASLVAQLVKNPPAVQETWVRSLGQEKPMDKGA